jgi:hypothetical protein
MAVTNAAGRIHAYLQKVEGVDGNISMHDGMVLLFDSGTAASDNEKLRQLALQTELVLRQVDTVERLAKSKGVPEGIYARYLMQVRDGFSHGAMNATFQHLRSCATPEVLIVLEWLAFYLPPDQSDFVDSQSIRKLVDDLLAVRHDPAIGRLPEGLREFLSKHLDAVLAALSNFGITGCDPLTEAVQSFAMGVVLMDSRVKAQADSASTEARTYLKKASNALKSAAEVAATGGKGAEGIIKVYELADKSGPLLLGLFQSGN